MRGKITRRRRFGFLALPLLLALAGCGQQLNTSDPAELSAMQDRFASGDAIMACEAGCAYTYGANRQALHALYAAQDWNNLANKLLTIGDDSDQSWFYLASAAQGLGYDTAAQRYYFMSVAARFRCKGLLNVCDGLDLPSLTFNQLSSLDDKIQQSPEFAQLSGPASNPTQIHLVKNHGLLMAPALLNGKLPLLFAVDSGSSSVSIPVGAAEMLVHTGQLHKSDIIGLAASTLGNGSTSPLIIFHIHSLQVGNIVLTNLTGSISEGSGELLLGQSFLNRFKSWSINNAQGVLVLQQ